VKAITWTGRNLIKAVRGDLMLCQMSRSSKPQCEQDPACRCIFLNKLRRKLRRAYCYLQFLRLLERKENYTTPPISVPRTATRTCNSLPLTPCNLFACYTGRMNAYFLSETINFHSISHGTKFRTGVTLIFFSGFQHIA
jgi:hypothetical protein